MQSITVDGTIVKYVKDGDIVMMYWWDDSIGEERFANFVHSDLHALQEAIIGQKRAISPIPFSWVMDAEVYSLITMDGLEKMVSVSGKTHLHYNNARYAKESVRSLSGLDPDVFRVTRKYSMITLSYK
jgi:hypothetical protein